MSDSAGAPKLFISYRRDETPISAAWLYEVLADRFGESGVFMDLTLKPGEDFVERITEVLGVCHILLVVMGPRWAAPNDGTGPASIKDPDDFVRLEVELAMARPDVEVLPVLVDGAKMPHRDELPKEIQGLTRIQAQELTTRRRKADMAELVGRIEELLPPETMVRSPAERPPPPAEEEREPTSGGRPRWQIAAAIVAAIALAAMVVVVAGLEGDDGTVDYALKRDVLDLDARGSVVMFTTGDDGSELLGRLDPEGEITYPNREPANYTGMDVGTNARGSVEVVASGCCAPEGLFLKEGGGASPIQIAGPTRGADLDGSVAGALLGGNTVACMR